MKRPVEAKVNILFKAGSLSKAEFTGWIADRMNLNVEKRLLQLDLDILREHITTLLLQAVVLL